MRRFERGHGLERPRPKLLECARRTQRVLQGLWLPAANSSREVTTFKTLIPAEVLQRVAKRYGVKPEELVARTGRGLDARNVAMWMVWQTGDKSLREIGEMFGGWTMQPSRSESGERA